MPKFILDGKEYGGGSGGDPSIEITQAEYDELVQSNSIQKDVTYYITDSKDEMELDATIIKYDNTESVLESTDVQGAINELGSNLNEINTQFNNVNIQLQTIIEALERGIAPESLSGSVTVSCAGSGKHSQMIVFETPFASVPTVTANSNNFRISANVSSVTKASFILSGGNSSSSAHSATITWSAVV